MKPDRWQQVERLFVAASQRPSAEWQRFLSEQCGSDQALRLEVESLLTARSQAGNFLDTPALQVAAPVLIHDDPRATCGQMIGPYSLVSQLGKGGMGEVWRAFDSRVGREVAIKFCDSQFTSRFEREARAIAALNHPNVCQLYDIGANYLVMELVEGESPRGPLPLRTVLDYARQVAKALDAAHEKGIVHRDLKPGNIKIRPDGTVKVLDFGLAKVAPVPQSPAGDPAAVSMRATQVGTVLGTPAYMSPEQVRGYDVDKRADIWAFGVLLCELLTGVTPFDRTTQSDTVAAVLTAEPDIVSVPLEIQWLVRKCLDKDPQKRLRDIGDAWDLLGRPDATIVARPSSRFRRAGWIVSALLVVALASITWNGFPSRVPDDKPAVRLDVDLGAGVSIDGTGLANLVISPDGTRLAYVSHDRLFTQRVDETRPNELTSVESATAPFFSPDGQWIGFFGYGKLRKVSVNGGLPVDLWTMTSGYRAGASWGEDGNIIAPLSSTGPLLSISSAGGSPGPFTTLDRSRGEVSHRFPQVLPGGRAVIFTAHTATSGFDDANIDVITIADHRRRTLLRGGSFGRYLPSGHLTYVRRGVLYAMPFDISRLAPRGNATPVIGDVTYSATFGSAQVDVSRTGTLVYRTGKSRIGSVTLQVLDQSGRQEALLAKPEGYLNPRISPEGKRVAFSAGRGAARGLWVYNQQRNTTTSVHPQGRAGHAIWTPDGHFLVFHDEGGLFWMRAEDRDPVRLIASENFQVPTSFSPDGKTLVYQEASATGVGGWDIWIISVENDGTQLRARDPRPFLQTAAHEYNAAFSPDGRWLAYNSDASGRSEVYVRAFPDDGRNWQISNSGGSCPVFSRRGFKLLFMNEDDQIMAANYSSMGSEFRAHRAGLWSKAHIAHFGGDLWSYDVMPDGRVAALIQDAVEQEQHAQNHIIFFENFFEHLKRVAPRQ